MIKKICCTLVDSFSLMALVLSQIFFVLFFLSIFHNDGDGTKKKEKALRDKQVTYGFKFKRDDLF